jgi:hypothetical protein
MDKMDYAVTLPNGSPRIPKLSQSVVNGILKEMDCLSLRIIKAKKKIAKSCQIHILMET